MQADAAGPAPRQLLAARLQRLQSQGRLDGAALPSPCVAICRLTVDGSHCEGCFRSLDEIANWGHADTARQRAIWAAVLQRAGLEVPSGLAAPDTDVI